MRFFLDSSALFAIAISSKGGARELLRLAVDKQITLCASEKVFEEVEINLEENNKAFAVPIVKFIKDTRILEIIEVTDEEIQQAGGIATDKDDAHIVAAAKKANVNALVSFDRKHLHTKRVEAFIKTPVVIAGKALEMFRRS